MLPHNIELKLKMLINKKGTLMKLTNFTGTTDQDRINFLHTYRVKDFQSLRDILVGNPVSFVTVRHPFERLVSGYSMAKNKNIDYADTTFHDFIIKDVIMKVKENKSHEKFREMNPHWRPYNTYCAFCNIPYSVVSKMETFDQDKERILELAGLEDRQRGQRLYVHGGDDIQNMTRQLFKNISPQHKNDLLNIYKHDFKMFDYNDKSY